MQQHLKPSHHQPPETRMLNASLPSYMTEDMQKDWQSVIQWPHRVERGAFGCHNLLRQRRVVEKRSRLILKWKRFRKSVIEP